MVERTETGFEGLCILEPRLFPDARGYFYESYNQRDLEHLGISTVFVQDNHSCSHQGTLRGMHYQLAPGQVKLVRVVVGEIYDVVVDLRRDQPTYGRWFAVTLSAENKRMLYIPAGFAHGFCATSPVAEFLYKVSSFYDPPAERGLAWDDPQIGIPWPVANPLLSERDQRHPRLAEISPADLF
ncbi:MAG: dTDP-4-dehydrorhamnose 3,5-epimerase [Chloroflexi bacterium]|nr:dTDP-4-dehydrorhamnose 3,5-epimerase [Chloroflexota bacterium]